MIGSAVGNKVFTQCLKAIKQQSDLMLKRAVEIINTLDSSKFPLLLARISQKLHIKDEKAFTDIEEEKLQSTFKLSAEELDLVIGTCEFFLQQAAYHGLKPNVFTGHLTKLDLSEEKASALSETWASCGREVIDKLKQHSLAQKKLDSVNWKLGLVMAQSSQSKLKQPNAQFLFKLSDDSDQKTESIQVEFTHEELYRFYNQLEAVQSQLDSLS